MHWILCAQGHSRTLLRAFTQPDVLLSWVKWLTGFVLRALPAAIRGDFQGPIRAQAAAVCPYILRQAFLPPRNVDQEDS